MVDTPSPPDQMSPMPRLTDWRRPLLLLCIGVVLGAGALLADVADGAIGQVLYALFSTAVFWGGAAVLAGAGAGSARRAALAGVAVLLVATVLYYGLILWLGLREAAGTASVVRAALIWAVVSVVFGAVGGFLGWLSRRGDRRTRSYALGMVCGALASQVVFEIVRGADYIFEENARAVLISSAVQLAIPLFVLVMQRRRVRLWLALATTVVVAAVGALAWSTVVGMIDG